MGCYFNEHFKQLVVWSEWHRQELQFRLYQVLRRCSMRRWIGQKEVAELAWRWARKHSGNPFQTVRKGGWDDEQTTRIALWKGKWILYEQVDWQDLEREARATGAQFCDLERRRYSTISFLYRRERDVHETRRFINQLKKEIRNEQATSVVR